jgi:hypothetical protein
MRNTTRVVPLFPAILAALLFSVIAAPASAAGAGDDTPAKPVATAARPDHEKKVFTNDDIDQMWPKAQAAASVAPSSPASTTIATAARKPVPMSRTAQAASVPVSPEKNPVWYATQIESLNAELEQISTREANMRNFRENGTDSGVQVGLQFGAPCEGITTDNAIAQLALRRQEIEQQISDLQDMAQQNGMPRTIVQDAPEILQAAQKPLTPRQEEAALKRRQGELINKLDGVQNELAGMSSQAAAQGIALLPVTPNWGGNLTTNLIQTLDNRAGEIHNALSANEDAARRAGLASSTLP